MRTTIYKIDVLAVSKMEAEKEAEEKVMNGDGLPINDKAVSIDCKRTNQGVIEIGVDLKRQYDFRTQNEKSGE